ncbi:hypothetical protein JMN32_08525 [Fulvivirga sp. 29W222]|uniref:Uncharacterized protein n=1 Tax=Fulvivirga marina TaxID=2494733 RepID=A0A937FUH4_9BACT|nr:hypothetical protein [Fulvivirga marina]MBL6446350.1 hypothetical protein [Fulvivirga marina]
MDRKYSQEEIDQLLSLQRRSLKAPSFILSIPVHFLKDGFESPLLISVK